MITVRLRAFAIKDLARLCRVKAKCVTQDRSYWLNLASTLDDAVKADIARYIKPEGSDSQ